jgi:hypothetical protein
MFSGCAFIPYFSEQRRIFALAWLYINLISSASLAQPPDGMGGDTLNPATIPVICPIHPLGLYQSQVPHRFNMSTASEPFIEVGLSSANIWLPPVTGAVPLDSKVRKEISEIAWHARQYDYPTLAYDQVESFALSADAVVKELRLRFFYPLSDRHELTAGIPVYMITGGTPPFSLLTSDHFIEFFHDHIAGGHDPFARRQYGLGKAGISYTDREGRSVTVSSGDIILPGIEFQYAFSPRFKSHGNVPFEVMTVIHSGFNWTRVNKSLDFGASLSVSRKVIAIRNCDFRFAISGAMFRQGVWQGNEAILIGTNPFRGSFSTLVEFDRYGTKGRRFSIALNYRIQTSYFGRSEFDSVILSGDRVRPSWHFTLSHMYQALEYWQLFLSWSRKAAVFIYIQQDFNVNNAPDLQTGIIWRLDL